MTNSEYPIDNCTLYVSGAMLPAMIVTHVLEAIQDKINSIEPPRAAILANHCPESKRLGLFGFVLGVLSCNCVPRAYVLPPCRSFVMLPYPLGRIRMA